VEALRDQVLAPTVERFTTIYSEVMHLQHLVEDLRTLSLADAGELRLQRQVVAPQSLLQRCAAAHAPLATQKGVALEVELSPDLPSVQVDTERMAQVMGNLVSNALRHTPSGGRITLSAVSDAGQVLLRVQDTGEGIPADALPRLFDRFYRVDSSRQRVEGESGLGLAIVRSLVEAHGAQVSVQSTPGQGTTFTITLSPA
jgi:signal transduction histidine kinase